MKYRLLIIPSVAIVRYFSFLHQKSNILKKNHAVQQKYDERKNLAPILYYLLSDTQLVFSHHVFVVEKPCFFEGWCNL